MADFRRQVIVTIPSTSLENGFVFYKGVADVVNSAVEHSEINRRFSNFDDLFVALTKKFGTKNVPTFPAKT